MTDAQADTTSMDKQWRLAAAVREACIRAALDGYQDARADGLCYEGAWECAIAAVRSLKLKTVVENAFVQKEGGS